MLPCPTAHFFSSPPQLHSVHHYPFSGLFHSLSSCLCAFRLAPSPSVHLASWAIILKCKSDKVKSFRGFPYPLSVNKVSAPYHSSWESDLLASAYFSSFVSSNLRSHSMPQHGNTSSRTHRACHILTSRSLYILVPMPRMLFSFCLSHCA